MNTSLKLHGLVAAVHTPFKADGSLTVSYTHLDVYKRQLLDGFRSVAAG